MQTVRSKRSRKIKGKSHSPSKTPKLVKVPLKKSQKVCVEIKRVAVDKIIKDIFQTPKKTLSIPAKKSSEKRQRKTPIENLRSDLSPKYIGFSPDDDDSRRSRYGRQQRTPSKLRAITSPGPVFEQKFVSYESPIEKLIQKNKYLANMTSPEEDINNSIMEPEVDNMDSCFANLPKTPEKPKPQKITKQLQVNLSARNFFANPCTSVLQAGTTRKVEGDNAKRFVSENLSKIQFNSKSEKLCKQVQIAVCQKKNLETRTSLTKTSLQEATSRSRDEEDIESHVLENFAKAVDKSKPRNSTKLVQVTTLPPKIILGTVISPVNTLLEEDTLSNQKGDIMERVVSEKQIKHKSRQLIKQVQVLSSPQEILDPLPSPVNTATPGNQEKDNGSYASENICKTPDKSQTLQVTTPPPNTILGTLTEDTLRNPKGDIMESLLSETQTEHKLHKSSKQMQKLQSPKEILETLISPVNTAIQGNQEKYNVESYAPESICKTSDKSQTRKSNIQVTTSPPKIILGIRASPLNMSLEEDTLRNQKGDIMESLLSETQTEHKLRKSSKQVQMLHSPKKILETLASPVNTVIPENQEQYNAESYTSENICKTPDKSKIRKLTKQVQVSPKGILTNATLQVNTSLQVITSRNDELENVEAGVSEMFSKTLEMPKTRKLITQEQVILPPKKKIVIMTSPVVISSQNVTPANDVDNDNSYASENFSKTPENFKTRKLSNQVLLSLSLNKNFATRTLPVNPSTEAAGPNSQKQEDKGGSLPIPITPVNLLSQAVLPIAKKSQLNLEEEKKEAILTISTSPVNVEEILPVTTNSQNNLQKEDKETHLAIVPMPVSLSAQSVSSTAKNLNVEMAGKEHILLTPNSQPVLPTERNSQFNLEKKNKEVTPNTATLISKSDEIESNSKTASSYDFIVYDTSLKLIKHDENIRQMNKSPSTNSTDSAKGSSIDTDIEPASKAGSIFWGRISSFPYWPCIVSPDPQGRTICTTGKNQDVKIHVRFFADNGRRSWVRKIDMFPYNGRIDFDIRMKDAFSKYHKRHLQYRAFFINDRKKPLWELAISEADVLLSEPIGNRSLKFDSILEETRKKTMVNKRNRRRSFNESRMSAKYFSGMSEDTFSIFSEPMDYFSTIKRERSVTPDSPAFEHIDDFVKRRKLDLNATQNMKSLEDLSSIHSVETENIFDDDEFKRLFELMKSYTMINNNEALEKQLYQNVKEIWNIRNLTQKELKDTSLNSFMSTSEMNIRRLSSRMRTLTKKDNLLLSGDGSTGGQHEKKLKKKKLAKPMEEVIEDIMNLNKNYLFKGLTRESVCKVCYKPENLLKCSGLCQSWVHQDCIIVNEDDSMKCSEDIHVTGDSDESLQVIPAVNKSLSEKILCKDCSSGEAMQCFVCKKSDPSLGERIKCHINSCRKYYHISCLKYWPQSKVTKSSAKIESLLCSCHVCHTCVSDDPRGKFLQIDKLKLAKCIICPATYHLDSLCIPAGTKFLTSTNIICPRHRKDEEKNVNVNWCFICTAGGRLMCCETCPTAFHIECLKMPQPDGSYICEECETGRLPLYGEMVWAKLAHYRWWPAIIIPPPEIPKNLLHKKHVESEFCIRFFGSNDHAWISRKRVFLYQEGDWGFVATSTGLDNSYKNALVEAKRIYELIKAKKCSQNIDNKDKRLRPLPYIKIKINRPVPPVKLQEVDISELTACDCNPSDLSPCGPYSGCLNRLLLTECNPKICPVGEKCQNQMFDKRLYPPLKVSRTNGKGWGLVCENELISGAFIIEYVGEVIDVAEFKRRIAQKQEEKDENYYFLTLEKDYMIDAGPKGNLARFMNHSCEPNCETQKWNVNGVTRVGLFAIKDILANTELTFNYNLECIGDDKKVCHCGAEKCAGFIGAKYKEKEKIQTGQSTITKTKAKRGVSKKSRKITKKKLQLPAPEET